jgi:hypothetical protein
VLDYSTLQFTISSNYYTSSVSMGRETAKVPIDGNFGSDGKYLDWSRFQDYIFRNSVSCALRKLYRNQPGFSKSFTGFKVPSGQTS